MKSLFLILGQRVIPVIRNTTVLQVAGNLQAGLGIMKAAEPMSPLSTTKRAKEI